MYIKRYNTQAIRIIHDVIVKKLCRGLLQTYITSYSYFYLQHYSTSKDEHTHIYLTYTYTWLYYLYLLRKRIWKLGIYIHIPTTETSKDEHIHIFMCMENKTGEKGWPIGCSQNRYWMRQQYFEYLSSDDSLPSLAHEYMYKYIYMYIYVYIYIHDLLK